MGFQILMPEAATKIGNKLMHKIDVYCSVRKKYILVIQNFQISDKHFMNRHLASHVTCPHCKSFLLFVHIERSHGEPSSMVPVHRRPVGAGAATKKKNTLRWDIVEYLERAECGGFFPSVESYTLPSHRERLKRSTSSENFPTKT